MPIEGNSNTTIIVYNVSQVAKILGVSLSKAYEIFHSKDFPSLILGRRMLVYEAAFIRWMEQRREI